MKKNRAAIAARHIVVCRTPSMLACRTSSLIASLTQMRDNRGQGNECKNQGDRANNPNKSFQASIYAAAGAAHFFLRGHACDKGRISRAQGCPGKLQPMFYQ
jgi:hypothetical protein